MTTGRKAADNKGFAIAGLPFPVGTRFLPRSYYPKRFNLRVVNLSLRNKIPKNNFINLVTNLIKLTQSKLYYFIDWQ